MSKSYRFLFASFLFVTFFSHAQNPIKKDAAAIYNDIQKLNFLGSVLYLAAHPDDENTRLISYYSNSVHARTAYLSLTRGDGGQNLIGTELREKLGVKKIWLFGHSDQSAIALQYAVEYPKNISGIILSGTSYVGSQNESIERRKTSENKRIKESKWFAKVIEDWDYMIENNTTFDKNGNDISTARTKWWTYDEETAQKVIPIHHPAD